MRELKPIKEGKVREIYDNGDSLIMVATDRISCFDVILNNVVGNVGCRFLCVDDGAHITILPRSPGHTRTAVFSVRP